MATIFSEDFSGFAIGSTPADWASPKWDVPPSSGAVNTLDVNGTTVHSFQLGTLQHTEPLGAFGFVSNRIYIYMGLGPNTNAGIPMIAGQLGTGGYEVFGVGLNGDGTLFCRVLADPSAHTTTPAGIGITALKRNTGYQIIANAEFFQYIDVDMIPKVAVQVNVAVDGFEEINNFILTGVPLAAVGGTLGMDRWVFQPGTIGGSTITNIVVNTDSGSITPPAATAAPDIFQGAIEVVYTSNPEAVIYQGVIELVQSLVPPPTAIAHCVMHD